MSGWKTCNYSRGEIDRAGQVLRGKLTHENFSQYIDAYSVMDNWRASHSFPLNTIQMSLRRRSKNVDRSADIVQRLKRAPSVISKLRRYDGMLLSRMQDLGGCRAILGGVADVYSVREQYRKSRDRHDLATEKDYIAEPQSSGYRGIHLIYKYRSDRSNAYNDHRIEIQLRSRIQHAWATAVEIAGVYVRTPLKSSIGPTEWLDFFKFASSAFSILENTPRVHQSESEAEIIKSLKDIDKRIDARNKLSSFNSAHDYIAQSRRKSDTHFILTLDLSEQKTFIEAFDNFSIATSRYSDLEKKYIDNAMVDVVLVAAENIESATHAYPNYFVDTTEFIQILDGVLS
ncbi:RelA/SpoT domain-containing protein [Defluviimonas sp. SAOS-178_SWC]|uniref:RelA/SpoT domain-containing protein n=1 Tax=Defluviimonas sp. SAOS-178_SWC TaxID=3121287 RepID=UPI0032221215